MTGVLGSSVNFTWDFSGSNVKLVQWGTKQDNAIALKDVLVTIKKVTVITVDSPPYSGRVRGVWDGSSPGQATFTLSSIQKADERLYICRLVPSSIIPLVFDTVQLVVLGK